jgi:hypothetical protein
MLELCVALLAIIYAPSRSISSYLIRQPAGGKVPGGDEAAVYEEEYAY